MRQTSPHGRSSPNRAATPEGAGPDPGSIGIEVWVSKEKGDEAAWRDEVRLRKSAAVAHVSLNTTHGRTVGRTLAAHLSALARYRDAVTDLLRMPPLSP